MSIFVIMANSSYHNHFIWIPLGYASCLILLILMDLIDAPMIWKALIYVITGFVLIFMVEITIQVFRKLKKGKKTSTMVKFTNIFSSFKKLIRLSLFEKNCFMNILSKCYLKDHQKIGLIFFIKKSK